MISSHGNDFCIYGHPVMGIHHRHHHQWFPWQMASNSDLKDVFFLISLHKLVKKQWGYWWFDVPQWLFDFPVMGRAIRYFGISCHIPWFLGGPPGELPEGSIESDSMKLRVLRNLAYMSVYKQVVLWFILQHHAMVKGSCFLVSHASCIFHVVNSLWPSDTIWS